MSVLRKNRLTLLTPTKSKNPNTDVKIHTIIVIQWSKITIKIQDLYKVAKTINDIILEMTSPNLQIRRKMVPGHVKTVPSESSASFCLL